MGNELQCKVRLGRQESTGKALLETNEILFRGDFRLKIPFSTIHSAKAVAGELRLQTAEGLVVFHIGTQAEKWCEKILHPKSRIEKLGVKPGARVALLGEFDAGFLREVDGHTKLVSKGKAAGDMDCIFFAAEAKKDLGATLAKIAKSMEGATALWIVYPKGQKDITENDVLAAGRRSGLKDVKVVGFSVTHTALKFVIPLSAR
jgi:hypothetical protein